MTLDVIHLLTRFVHVGSVILFLGGVAYARQVLVPALNELPQDMKLKMAAGAQNRYRSTLFVLLTLIVLSGLYNMLTGPVHTRPWHMWFGIKMLAVLHILATAILWATSKYGDIQPEGKPKRRLASMTVAGLIAVLISAYLRWLTQQGM